MSAPTDIRRPLGPEKVIDFDVVGYELHAGGAIAVITLAPVGLSPAPEWTPGAHVDVLLDNGIERQYSLCGEIGAGNLWRLGVLREPQSRGGSEYIHEQVRVGSRLRLQGPRNNFELVDAPSFQFIAGGIGITPILPMIREAQRRGVPWALTYGGRSLSSMAFLDEIEVYGDAVTLWPQDSMGIIPIREIVDGLLGDAVVYCCGPEPLLNAVEDAMPPMEMDRLHTERFRPRQGLLDQARTAFDIVLDYSGLELHVPADKSIVEVVEAAGIDVMTSCREGTCGTCETVVMHGTPDHRDSYLNAAEKASNEMMMICCSRSKSPRLVLDL